MKKIVALLLAIVCLQAAAQEPDSVRYRYYSDGRAVVKRDSLYGFVDRNGTEVIPCRFKKAYNFNDGIAMVRLGYEVFAIDTLGNRLDCRVKIPQFYNRDFESFVRWVRQRIPFRSSGEYERFESERVNALITIGRDGKIVGCDDVSSTSEEAFGKVREVVMQSPEWSAGEVDGRAVEIRYLLPVDFGRLRTPQCRPVDVPAEKLHGDFVYPLFEGQYAPMFRSWFFKNLRFRNSLEYQRADNGVIRLAFTIDRKGNLRNVTVIESHNDACLVATLRTLKKSPRWTPGTIDGKPVDTACEMSFLFRFRRR